MSGSTTLRKLHTGACSNETPIMQKSCSNSDGCTTSRAPVSTVKKVPSSILRSLSARVRTFDHVKGCLTGCLTDLYPDNNDAQSWYLLGRCYMSQQKYPKAYDAYQQAVYRDGRNPTFWCSIGVLYYQINQYRDALDAYSRAIRLNPYISEVWYDLGTLVSLLHTQS